MTTLPFFAVDGFSAYDEFDDLSLKLVSSSSLSECFRLVEEDVLNLDFFSLGIFFDTVTLLLLGLKSFTLLILLLETLCLFRRGDCDLDLLTVHEEQINRLC